MVKFICSWCHYKGINLVQYLWPIKSNTLNPKKIQGKSETKVFPHYLAMPQTFFNPLSVNPTK